MSNVLSHTELGEVRATLEALGCLETDEGVVIWESVEIALSTDKLVVIKRDIDEGYVLEFAG